MLWTTVILVSYGDYLSNCCKNLLGDFYSIEHFELIQSKIKNNHYN